jgi:hypothetical protein
LQASIETEAHANLFFSDKVPFQELLKTMPNRAGQSGSLSDRPCEALRG